MKIRFAVAPGIRDFSPEALDEFLDAAEQLGFDTVWLSDVPLGTIGDPLTSLAYAAARTRRVKLGANVVPLGRNPMLLARELAQIDQLSGGRLLLSFVPGLNQPGETAALGGTVGAGRGEAMASSMELCRRWWAGERVSGHHGGLDFEDIEVLPRPVQDPLEIWLGGHGPEALRRTGRIADGWLTAGISPTEAGAGRASIEAAAAEAGRHIDPEHFGISMPYARAGAIDDVALRLRTRRSDVPVEEILPVGAYALVSLVRRHVDQGISKFVLRPVAPAATVTEDLRWLAEAVLSLQT